MVKKDALLAERERRGGEKKINGGVPIIQESHALEPKPIRVHHKHHADWKGLRPPADEPQGVRLTLNVMTLLLFLQLPPPLSVFLTTFRSAVHRYDYYLSTDDPLLLRPPVGPHDLVLFTSSHCMCLYYVVGLLAQGTYHSSWAEGTQKSDLSLPLRTKLPSESSVGQKCFVG